MLVAVSEQPTLAPPTVPVHASVIELAECYPGCRRSEHLQSDFRTPYYAVIRN